MAGLKPTHRDTVRAGLTAGEPPPIARTKAEPPREGTPSRRARRKTTGDTTTEARGRREESFHLDPTDLPLDPVRAARDGARAGRWNKHGALLITAKSVEDLVHSGDLSSITPAIPRHLWPTVQAVLECYSIDGPLGSHGALSARGPIGNSPWNVSFWTRHEDDRSDRLARLTDAGGPGSDLGPLGSHGPDSKHAKEDLLPRINELANQLQAGGLFSAVGPESALGPKGPLGFLGVLGGHGFAQNANGDFVGGGEVKRTTDVRYEGGHRTHELVELYREAHAKGLEDNDTSWMVRGVIERGEQDTFAFTSRQDQFVTITLVPENISEVFHLELLDRDGNVVARSDSDRYINWIQVQADAAREMKVRVTMKESRGAGEVLAHPAAMFIDAMLTPLIAWGHAAEPFLRAGGRDVDRAFERGAYRLCVVGSTEDTAETNIEGDHQRRINWPDAGR